MENQIYDYYSQSGGSLNVFAGSRRQGGGGFFSTLARFALPLLKNIGGRALRVASRTAKDVLNNRRSLGNSLLHNATKEVANSYSDDEDINKTGSGLKRKRTIRDIFARYKKRRRT